MRRLLTLCLPLAVCAACFDKSDDDAEDETDNDAPLFGSDGGDDGGEGDEGADSGETGVTEATAAGDLAVAMCAYIDECFSLEGAEFGSMEHCVESTTSGFEESFSSCDVDLDAVQECLDDLADARASGNCDDDGYGSCASGFCL